MERRPFRPQPENPKNNAPEAGAGPLGIPPPDPEHLPQQNNLQKEPIPLLDPIARSMRKVAQREGKDQLPLIQRMLATLAPREAEILRRRFGIPPDQSTTSAEE